MKLSRRSLLRSTAAALAAPALGALGAAPAAAQGERNWKHGLSLFGEPKYPAGFKNYDYVNPAAPQGGVVRQMALGTFDNFNEVIAFVKGNIAANAGIINESLMASSLDEVATGYGLLAEAVAFPDDRSSVTYRLRANARWHDGMPVTADDVIFSFNAFKENSPPHAAYYRHVVKVEKSGDRDVTFTFDMPGNRELPQIVGELTVFPKHWWEGTDKSGKKRDITQTTLEPPLGSGPYRIKDFEPGHSITYEKVADYWGSDLNINTGTNNFAQLRFDYFRDSNVALEAFKGDQFDWRIENTAKDWATAYDFPARRDGRVLLDEFPIRSSGIMQGFVFNIRREKFKDPRVRRAFNFALDYEEMNRQIFYGQYTRIGSYFEGTELASSGLPQGRELEILQTVKDKVPPELFTTPYTNPVGGDPQKVRDNFRQALALFRAAGYEIKDTKLVSTKTNEQFSLEFLNVQPAFERIMLIYKASLEKLGISASIRTVDSSQYENRERQWDFDVIISSWGESLSPGNEQRGYWGSQAADQPGSRNLIGIKNEAVDAMIDRIIYAKDRDELVAATHALDRVLLWNFYVVPQWTYGKVRTARWDRFSRPSTMPKYGATAFPTIWWWDADKAAKVPQKT